MEGEPTHYQKAQERRVRFRAAFRELPRIGKVCFYLTLASFLLLPLTGLFGIFGSIVSRSPFIPVAKTWAASISALTCVVSFTYVGLLENRQLRAKGLAVPPLQKQFIPWFIFILIVFMLWLIVVLSKPEHRHNRPHRASLNADANG